MRVALVHEHLTQDGGAERVVRIFQRMFPKAPLFTLAYNAERAHPDFRGTDIRPSFIQRMPGGLRFFQWYLSIMPTAVESFDLTQYDLVLSSSSAFAKGVITLPHTLHVCYLHSPTRYLWSDTHRYVQELQYPGWMRNLIPYPLTRIRQWDRLAADRVDAFVANSKLVSDRIAKYYRRQSTIIYPPVDVEQYSIAPKIGNYYLTGGRLVPYKRFDIAIEAFNRTGLPLKIFGTGPAMKQLQAMAKSNIEFLERVEDGDLNALYGQAIAFINPQEEDFGLTAVETMATGRPVIAYAAGGALETVKSGQTGILFEDQDWASLADAVIRFHPEQFQPEAIRQWALTFGVNRFIKQMSTYIDTAWQKHQSAVGLQ